MDALEKLLLDTASESFDYNLFRRRLIQRLSEAELHRQAEKNAGLVADEAEKRRVASATQRLLEADDDE